MALAREGQIAVILAPSLSSMPLVFFATTFAPNPSCTPLVLFATNLSCTPLVFFATTSPPPPGCSCRTLVFHGAKFTARTTGTTLWCSNANGYGFSTLMFILMACKTMCILVCTPTRGTCALFVE